MASEGSGRSPSVTDKYTSGTSAPTNHSAANAVRRLSAKPIVHVIDTKNTRLNPTWAIAATTAAIPNSIVAANVNDRSAA